MIEFKKFQENFEYPDAKVVEFEGEDLFIKQYLPMNKKYDIIQVTIFMIGLKEGKASPILSEVVFHNELVEAYTNINFESSKQEFFKTYDILNLSGLLELIISNIPVSEYEEICKLYEECLEEAKQHSRSFVSLIGAIVEAITDGSLQNIGQEINDFDVNKHEAVLGILKKLGDEQHI